MAKINKYLDNDKYIFILSKEIFKLFKSKSNKNNVHLDFDIKDGIILDTINTWFSEDVDKNSELYKYKKCLFDKDLVHLSKKEELELNKKIDKFHEKISSLIIKNHIKDIRKIIRKICMPDANKETVPMRKIEIRKLDIVDIDVIYSEPGPYNLINFKDPNDLEYNEDDYKEPIQIRIKKMMDFIVEEMKETGKTAIEVFDKEKTKSKNEKHSSFIPISKLSRLEKMDWDLSISFFVDYNLQYPCAWYNIEGDILHVYIKPPKIACFSKWISPYLSLNIENDTNKIIGFEIWGYNKILELVEKYKENKEYSYVFNGPEYPYAYIDNDNNILSIISKKTKDIICDEQFKNVDFLNVIQDKKTEKVVGIEICNYDQILKIIEKTKNMNYNENEQKESMEKVTKMMKKSGFKLTEGDKE